MMTKRAVISDTDTPPAEDQAQATPSQSADDRLRDASRVKAASTLEKTADSKD